MKTVIHSAKDRGVLYPLTPFLYMGGLDGAEMVPGSLFVPPFYAGKLTDKEEWHLTIVGVLAATIFGGVHCIAWSFQFPSLTERVLWRMSSVAITCLPAIILRTIFALGSSPSDLIHRRLVWSAGMAGFFLCPGSNYVAGPGIDVYKVPPCWSVPNSQMDHLHTTCVVLYISH